MFERFTDRARRVVVLAQEEARLLDHIYIGTEHLLLGLIHEGEGTAAKALEFFDVTLEAVRDQVLDIIGEGTSSPSGHIPFTPRSKKVLELALREAQQLGHNYIGTEHILLALIREGEGVGVQILQKLDVKLPDARTLTLGCIKFLRDNPLQELNVPSLSSFLAEQKAQEEREAKGIDENGNVTLRGGGEEFVLSPQFFASLCRARGLAGGSSIGTHHIGPAMNST